MAKASKSVSSTEAHCSKRAVALRSLGLGIKLLPCPSYLAAIYLQIARDSVFGSKLQSLRLRERPWGGTDRRE